MFDRELDYYGIMSAEGITGQKSLPQIMAEVKRKFNVAKMDHDLFFLAHECHYKFYQNMLDDKNHKDPTTYIYSMRFDRHHMFYESVSKVHGGGKDRKDRKLFDTYLERHFSLMVSNIQSQVETVNRVNEFHFLLSVQMKK